MAVINTSIKSLNTFIFRVVKFSDLLSISKILQINHSPVLILRHELLKLAKWGMGVIKIGFASNSCKAYDSHLTAVWDYCVG